MRLEPVVGADPAEERAARQFEDAVHVLVRADVDGIDGPHPAILARVLLQRVDGVVVGGVVADHELEVREILGQHRLDAVPDALRVVAHGEADRESGGGCSLIILAPVAGRRRRAS